MKRCLGSSLDFARILFLLKRNLQHVDSMLDIMLCACLIEARSCERMTLLSVALKDKNPNLARFYRGLLACEARHHQMYIDLASSVFPRKEIEERLHVIAAHESSVLLEEGKLIRLHS